MKVLVVEDNRLNLELATDLLEASGHQVDAAIDGAALRQRLADDAAFPAIILMDIQLPDVDGVTLMHEVRADSRFARVPIVALTAHALTGESERLRVDGFDAVMTKPIDTRRFVDDVEALARAGRIENR